MKGKDVIVVSRPKADCTPVVHTEVIQSFDEEVVEKAVVAFLEVWYEHKTPAEIRAISVKAYEGMLNDGYYTMDDGICFTRGVSIVRK